MAEHIGSIIRPNAYLPGEFYGFTVLQILSREKVKFQAGKKMAILQYQTASNKEFWQQMMRPLYQRKRHVQEVYNSLDKKGEIPVRAWTGIVLSAKDRNKLEEATSMAQSLSRSVGMELFSESAIVLPTWLASLPGQYREGIDDAQKGLQRGTTMCAKNAATLTYVQGDWKGSSSKQGGLLVMSRRGALTSINLFDTYKSNYNAIIAASSGSGKSFMINEIAVDFLARGGLVRIIDAGRSYYNTAELLRGENLVFDRQANFCVNPFSEIYTQLDLQEDMDMLVVLIAQMAFPFGFGKTQSSEFSRPYEYRRIEEAIDYLWQQKRQSMSVRDIADYFLDSTEENLRKIGKQLRPWAYGRYSKWMVGNSNMSFNSPFLVLELDDLSDEPELQTIILNLMLARISREMYLGYQIEESEKIKKRPKLIVIDEAWDLLNRKNTAEFIEKSYRRARKYACSMIIVTQSFTDCEKTSAAKTALENANWIISLVHDMGALEKAIEENLLNISDYSKQMIRGLQKTDQYSEFYIINKSIKGEGLYRLFVDPSTYWMYTSDAADKNKLNELMNQGIKLDKAIEILSKNFNAKDKL